MKYPNENMEEFFKKSLDKFSDEPSERVWSDLDKRLDEDKPKGIFLNWFKYFIPMILLFGGFSGVYMYQLHLLRNYEIQLSEIADQNKDLRLELELKNNSIENILQQTQDESSENKILVDKNTIKTISLRDTVFIVKYFQNELKVNWLSTLNRPTFNFSQKPADHLLFGQFKAFRNSQDLSSNDKHGFLQIPLLFAKKIEEKPLFSSRASDSFFSKMNLVSRDKSNRKRKKKKLGLFDSSGPIIIDKTDPWGKPEFYYKAGFTFNILNSLKGEQFSNSSIGFGYGLVQQIGLTSRFAISSGILRNIQEYALNNKGLPLDMEQIISFPNQENLSSDIVRAEVENRFWEIPLGIKYDFYQDNKKSLFVNPGVKWSIHQPQQFNYYLAEDRFRSFSTNKKFGYLNAIHFAVGLEKTLSPFTSYQIILGYDHNLEPIGVEQQRLNSMYLKCNVLFGKK